MRAKAFLLPSIFFLLTLNPSAQPTFPKPTGFINDFANILDESAEQSLDQAVREIQRQTSVEIAVVTVSTLNRMSVEEYANRLFKEWGIGKAREDNGVLVLLSTEDHDIRIEVGYGLEGVIPDGLAGEIIRNDMTPRFKAGDFAGGLRVAVRHIGVLVRAHHVLTPEQRERLDHPPVQQGAVWILIPFMGLFVGVGAVMVGIGLKSKTVLALLFGVVFGGIPFLICLGVAFWPSLLTLTPLAVVVARMGYRNGEITKGALGGKKSGWTIGGGGSSGGSSSGSSWSSGGGSSSSGGSFGGGSSGGGGASGKW